MRLPNLLATRRGRLAAFFFLYITEGIPLGFTATGDGTNPSPPDGRDTGQDISDLLASILRIDVNVTHSLRERNAANYSIPKDNPFVNTPGARPEVWAYGFRNPWKMSFDPKTGYLWIAELYGG